MNQVDANFETLEAGNLRLKLRAGVQFELQERGNEAFYVVQDELTSSFFQVGIEETAILSLFDGSTTLQQTVEETASRLGNKALTLQEAIRIAHWSLESGISFSVDETGAPNSDAENFLEQLEDHSRKRVASQLNPLFIRIPLGDPSAFVKRLCPFLGWMASSLFLFVWLAIIGFASISLFQNSEQITQSMLGILAPNAWGWLLATIVLLKLVHETAHATFCQVFGGRVREAGIMLILFLPLPFVDVTSSWSFSSRWKRIAVAGAGMYVEIFLAAIAAIAWCQISDPVWRFHLFNVVLSGSITTLLFNANFLMRFDGYFILSDLLEIPNLYQKGQQRVGMLGKRFLLGVRDRVEPETAGRNLVIWIYGILAWVWRILVCISLCILATSLFYGFGIALAILGVVIWVATPVARFLKQWVDPAASVRPDFAWMLVVTIPVIAGLLFCINYTPYPVQVWAPAVVEYEAPKIIRADSDGFIQSVNVLDGQTVKEGDLLMILENRQLDSRKKILVLEIQTSLIRERSLRQKQDIAAVKAEQAKRFSINEELAEVDRRINSLVIYSPANGIVSGDKIAELQGQFVQRGQGMLNIVNESEKIITASIGQDNVDSFSGFVDREVHFRPRYDDKTFSGKLGVLKPAADNSVDPRLTSAFGGDLSVRREQNLGRSEASNSESPFKLVSYRFEGEVELAHEQANELKVGTVGYIRLKKYNGTVGEKISVTIRKWWEQACLQIQADR